MRHFRYSPKAVAGIYAIPRGVAGEVTEAIKAIVHNPRAGKQVEGREETYEIKAAGYTIRYELIQDQIVVLDIE